MDTTMIILGLAVLVAIGIFAAILIRDERKNKDAYKELQGFLDDNSWEDHMAQIKSKRKPFDKTSAYVGAVNEILNSDDDLSPEEKAAQKALLRKMNKSN